MHACKGPSFVTNAEFKRTPVLGSGLFCAIPSPSWQGAGPSRTAGKQTSILKSQSQGGTRAHLPHTSMHPQLLHHCSIISKNGSCCQLPESGPSEADRSRRGRRNICKQSTWTRLPNRPSLPSPHLAHPSGAQHKRQQMGPADSHCLGSSSSKDFRAQEKLQVRERKG